MEIKHKEVNGQGLFFIEADGRLVGRMSYSRKGTIVTIEHTNVDESLKGKGAGKQLVAKSVDWAREKDYQIVPVCEFAKQVFERVTEFQDVLHRP